MPRGGKREGAGRKPSSLTTKTREIAEKALAGELPLTLIDHEKTTPLEVMLYAMRAAVSVHKWDCALDAAKAAAPYVHPKLASVEHTGRDGEALVPGKIEIVFVSPKPE